MSCECPTWVATLFTPVPWKIGPENGAVLTYAGYSVMAQLQTGMHDTTKHRCGRHEVVTIIDNDCMWSMYV